MILKVVIYLLINPLEVYCEILKFESFHDFFYKNTLHKSFINFFKNINITVNDIRPYLCVRDIFAIVTVETDVGMFTFNYNSLLTAQTYVNDLVKFK